MESTKKIVQVVRRSGAMQKCRPPKFPVTIHYDDGSTADSYMAQSAIDEYATGVAASNDE